MIDEMMKSDWVMLGLKGITFAPDSDFAMLSNKLVPWVMQSFTNNLAQLDPGLALLMSMELAKEKGCEPHGLRRRAQVHGSRNGGDQTGLYRIARASKLVRTDGADEIGRAGVVAGQFARVGEANFFTLVPEDKVR